LGSISSAVLVRKRHRPRNQQTVWVLAVCGSVVVVAVVAVAIGLLSGGGGDGGPQTAAKPLALEPTLPDASVGKTEPSAPEESRPSQAEPPAAQEPVAANPTGGAGPKVSGAGPALPPQEAKRPVPVKEPTSAAAKPTPAANTEPPATPAAPENPPPTPPPAETLEQAEQRLNAEAAQASTVETQQLKAREVLKLADQAIVDSKAELAKRLAVLALKLARKSSSAGLVDEATMRMIELAQPVTDALKDKAKQRLDK
jgi:hypothetical protein